MQKLFSCLCILIYAKSSCQGLFQLARPFIKYKSVFFADSADLELRFAHPGGSIYYTVDSTMISENSTEPSEKDLLFKNPIILKNRFTTISAKAYCKGFKPSETIRISFAKQGKQIKKIISSAPNPKYAGSGESTLFDNKGGVEDLSSKTWMGYDKDTISFVVEFFRKEPVNTVLLSFLQNEDSWIFLPELILIYYFDDEKKTFIPFGREVNFSEEKSPLAISFRFILSKLDQVTTQKLLIDLTPVKKIPDWHPASGQHAWCFIDEIKVY